MNFIDKIKIENIDYDIRDTEGRKLIEECLTEELDPTVPECVKSITETNIDDWNSKSTFSGNYNDLTNIPSEFVPAQHSHTEYITKEELDETISNVVGIALNGEY